MRTTQTTSGARFMSNKEQFDAANYKDFEVTYTGRSGRAERAAMKQRLAEAKKARVPQPVSVGYIKINY